LTYGKADGILPAVEKRRVVPRRWCGKGRRLPGNSLPGALRFRSQAARRGHW